MPVGIVDDPALGIVEGNIKRKLAGERCQHLRGDTMLNYSCTMHNEPWFPETPCGKFDQPGPKDSICQLGVAFEVGRAFERGDEIGPAPEDDPGGMK